MRRSIFGRAPLDLNQERRDEVNAGGFRRSEPDDRRAPLSVICEQALHLLELVEHRRGALQEHLSRRREPRGLFHS
jgi:hypothetical protein